MAKILLVEDDSNCATFVSTWLTGQEHEVQIAADGGEAWKVMSTDRFDLILLDWDIPKLSGIELLRVYRNRGNHTPVIMLTGKSDIENKETGFDLGADDYLAKPFDLVELSARIRARLRRGTRAAAC